MPGAIMVRGRKRWFKAGDGKHRSLRAAEAVLNVHVVSRCEGVHPMEERRAAQLGRVALRHGVADAHHATVAIHARFEHCVDAADRRGTGLARDAIPRRGVLGMDGGRSVGGGDGAAEPPILDQRKHMVRDAVGYEERRLERRVEPWTAARLSAETVLLGVVRSEGSAPLPTKPSTMSCSALKKISAKKRYQRS